MPPSIQEKSDALSHKHSGIASYLERQGEYREYAPGKRVFRRVSHEYTFEEMEQSEVDQIDRRLVKRLFDGDRRGCPSGTVEGYSTGALLQIVKSDASTVTRSQALEVLLLRSVAEIGQLLIDELSYVNNSRSWRNTLLLASEHVHLGDAGQRSTLRGVLLQTCSAMGSESHPRSKLALCSALRTICAFTDALEAFSDLTRFLAPGHPLEAMRIILISIQESPLTRDFRGDQTTLPDLRAAIAAIAIGNLTRTVSEQSEDAFDLGLEALAALTAIGDRTVPELVGRAKALSIQWVDREIKKMGH